MPFTPLNTTNSDSQNLSQITDMFRELYDSRVVQVFKQPAGNAIINGRLPYEGGYGSLYYDSTGIPRVLIGIAPDGTTGLFVSKTGESVLDAF